MDIRTPGDPAAPLSMDGSWERPGKNPLIASFILVLIAGALFFSIPQVITAIVAGIMQAAENFRTLKGGTPDLMRALKFPVLIGTVVSQFLLFLFLPMLLVRRWHTRDIKVYYGYNRFPVRAVLLAFAAAVFLIPLVLGIDDLTNAFFPFLKKMGEQQAPLFKGEGAGDMTFLMFAIAVTPAVCEEALFRGYFQRTLQRGMRTPWHFILSGIIFALFHQQPLSLPALIPVGIFLGFAYWISNSIYPGMVAHFTYNAILVFLMNVELPEGPWLAGPNSLAWWVYVAGAVGLAGVIAVLWVIRVRVKKKSEPLISAEG